MFIDFVNNIFNQMVNTTMGPFQFKIKLKFGDIACNRQHFFCRLTPRWSSTHLTHDFP